LGRNTAKSQTVLPIARIIEKIGLKSSLLLHVSL
jgi:hypothetical protein